MNAPLRRPGSLIAGAAILGGLLLAPTAAQAHPLRAEVEAGACEITGGDLSWGVKESFRAYISGSIAKGSWETADGASYETPEFSWSGATGSIDPETGVGSVSFTGSVHFTGHDGVLDLTLANPTIEFEGGGKAALLLDARSTDMEGAVAVDATQEWVGDVVAPDQLPIADDALVADDLPSTLTNSGAKAFAGFYEAGEDLDPISLDLQFASCAGSGAAVAEPAPEASDDDPVAPAPESGDTAAAAAVPASVPWLPIIIGGIAILVIGVTGGMLLAGRKGRPSAGPAPAAESVQDPAQDPAPQTGPRANDRLFGEDR